MALSHDLNDKMLRLTEDEAIIMIDPSKVKNSTVKNDKILVLSTKPFQAVPFTFDLNGENWI